MDDASAQTSTDTVYIQSPTPLLFICMLEERWELLYKLAWVNHGSDLLLE